MFTHAFIVAAVVLAQPPSAPDWQAAEAAFLTGHIQITTRDRFIKAGEAYFDHNSPPRWIVFQAIPVPPSGKDPESFYSMYVAKLRYSGEFTITGIEEPIRISPDGSANTCGWFHPVFPFRVLFGSTLVAPANREKPGFRVGTRNYVWQFPDEMEIVERGVSAIAKDFPPDSPLGRQSASLESTMQDFEPHIREKNITPEESLKRSNELFAKLDQVAPDLRAVKSWISAKTVFEMPKYTAECSWSSDARFILYAQVRAELTREKDDADIFVFDTKTGEHHPLVVADGYDGGPFFSPDGQRICYRSDRKGDDKLQLFVADLKFENDVPVGITKEHQITANDHVNWAPYFHPSGKFLVYGTSEVSHANYEVFACELPPIGGDIAPDKLKHTRITTAPGADVLPVFSADAKYFMWTAQRGPTAAGEPKPSSQVWIAKTAGNWIP